MSDNFKEDVYPHRYNIDFERTVNAAWQGQQPYPVYYSVQVPPSKQVLSDLKFAHQHLNYSKARCAILYLRFLVLTFVMCLLTVCSRVFVWGPLSSTIIKNLFMWALVYLKIYAFILGGFFIVSAFYYYPEIRNIRQLPQLTETFPLINAIFQSVLVCVLTLAANAFFNLLGNLYCMAQTGMSNLNLKLFFYLDMIYSDIREKRRYQYVD